MTDFRAGEQKELSGNPEPKDFYCVNIGQSELQKVAASDKVSLRFGTAVVYADSASLKNEAPLGKLLIPNDMAGQLLLPKNENLGVVVRGSDIIFGPLIGVFVSRWETEHLSQGVCKNKYFYRYIQACKELNAICCFFSIEDILWNQRSVKAWVLQNVDGQAEHWLGRVFPIPSVIYDRCFGSLGKEDGYKLRSHLADIPGVTVFNAMPKLRKWETIELLWRNPELREHLPKTVQYRSPNQLERALNHFGPVYLKPDGLSKGTGIYKISRSIHGGFILRHRGPKKNELVRFSSLNTLGKLLEPYFERGGGYVIQQEIPLGKYRGRKFDMRVLCQRDIEGKWIIGGIAVRVAAPKSIITSPRSGGSVITFSHMLESVFNEREDQPGGISAKLNDVAFKVCRVIEEKYGCCGELGLDMTVDKDGHIWIIEVNAKPLKVSLKRLLNPDLTQQVHANPIRFAYYIAGTPGFGVE